LEQYFLLLCLLDKNKVGILGLKIDWKTKLILFMLDMFCLNCSPAEVRDVLSLVPVLPNSLVELSQEEV
jgi:hypothetical protein